VTDVLRVRRAALVAAAALAAVASLVAAPRASAATCGERVIADWRDGHITGTYSAACLRAALRHLPEDLRIYGSAEEDITRVLTRAVEAAPRGVLAATATRTRSVAKPSARTAASSPARKATRSLSGRRASPPTAVAMAARREVAGGGSAFAPARTAVAAAVLGLVAFAVAAVAWRTRRRRASRAL
jgi:hypothetical protein